MPHLSELHGAATHLAVVALPVYVLVLLARRAGWGGDALRRVEPWVVGAAVAGVALAGITGLLVRGQAQTMLRDGSGRLGTLHFWLGIALTVMVVVLAGWRWRRVARNHHTHGHELLAGGILAVVAVFVQGYAGGRMAYDQGVGVSGGGQFAQSAAGAKHLEVALARGEAPAAAGRVAFSASQLGCATCHGALAQGDRGPRLAGGKDLEEFRSVHGRGLFPPEIVSDRDFAAVNAWLKTLPGGRGPHG